MPIERCEAGGKTGWRWGGSGKCYTGPGAAARAAAQGAAARASGFVEKRVARERTFKHYAKAEGINEELGLVFGWGIVCQERVGDGDYFDVQDDHIPQEAMLRESTDFALHCRKSGEMHSREDGEGVAFLFPLTDEVAKAFGIQCEKRGLMMALKPSKGVLEKFKTGEYTGFSIGGVRIEDEEVD